MIWSNFDYKFIPYSNINITRTLHSNETMHSQGIWQHPFSKLLHHKDFVDSLNVVSTFFHAWMKINILLGLLRSFKGEKYISSFLRGYTKKWDKSDIKDRNAQNTKTSYDSNLLLVQRSCVARVICLFNQEISVHLKNPIGNVLAETLR